MSRPPFHPDRSRLDAFLRSDPVVARVRAAAGSTPVYLVGGAIRDALCGFPVDDIDLVVAGDPEDLIETLDPDARLHPQFGTAKLKVGRSRVDLARARTETYPYPGALPETRPGSIIDDLARRDFTINAIALPLTDREGQQLLDPFGGLADLSSGLLRVLHHDSFRDDPTRAIRAARYAARFGFVLARDTAKLVEGLDFSAISRDRYESELLLLAAEDQAPDGFRLLAEWHLSTVDPAGPDLADRVIRLLDTPLWRGAADRAEVVMSACVDLPRKAIERLRPEPGCPSDGLRRAASFTPAEIVLARADGVTWLDDWRETWRSVELEITGTDLLEAGVPQGPRIGIGLQAALRAKLDRGVAGAERELAEALRAAGTPG